MNIESKIAPGSLTLGEILQQPELWPDTLERVMAFDGGSLEGRPVVLCGAGTSAYAAAAVAAGWPNASAIPTTDLLLCSRNELLRQAPSFAENGVLISLARSGDSPESLAVVSKLQSLFPNVSQLAITCNGNGRLANEEGVQAIVLDPRSNDRSLAMTSSFSNLALAGMALLHGAALTESLPQVVQATRSATDQLDAAARSLAARKFSRVVVLASGALQPLADESCLKILEMTAGRTVAIPQTFLGLRHGPMSYLRGDSLVIAFLSSDAHKRKYEEDLLAELRQKKLGWLVAVADSDLPTLCDLSVPANAPHLPDYLRVPFEAVFPQLLAYHLSLTCDLDPDNPSPAGVITRVVQSFRLHE